MTGPMFADEAAHEAFLALPADPPQPNVPPVPQAEEPEPEKPFQENIPEFDERYREPFTGLLYVGALTKDVTVFGHHFTLATPTQTERLQMGPVIQPFAQTATGEQAYMTVLVSAYLTKIDGRELPKPILNDPKESALAERFRWVGENLKRQVINALFDECLALDNQVDEVLVAMGKAQG